METNLDGIYKVENDSHRPGVPTDRGVGSADPKSRLVHGTVNEIRSYTPQERIGDAVDSHEDRPP